MSNTRLYDSNIRINKHTVKNTFEQMFDKCDNKMSSCMLDMNNQYAEDRHKKELGRIRCITRDIENINAFDIGCGTARLIEAFDYEKLNSYTGVDFCEKYITYCKANFRDKKFAFHESDVNLIPNILNSLSFDVNVYLMCGILMYLSDDEIINLLKVLVTKFSKTGVFYIRETISVIDKQLTLNDFPSNEIGVNYSAIYRTTNRYLDLFSKTFDNAIIEHSKYLQENQLRKETNQQYFVIKLIKP